jgi:hypothetical protein
MSKPIGSFLTKIINQEHIWKTKLFGQWNSIVGNLKEKARIEKITENSLTIGVCHATWAQELFLLTPMIKKKINKILKEEKIKKINFKTVKFEKNKPKKNKKKAKKRRKELNLSITERADLGNVSCNELAQALEAFYTRCKRG